jgi:hypothetical protein
VDAHFLFEFSLTQFGGLYLYIHTFKVSNLINQNCKIYRCKLTSNASFTLTSLNLDMHVRRLMSCLAFVGGMGERNKSQKCVSKQRRKWKRNKYAQMTNEEEELFFSHAPKQRYFGAFDFFFSKLFVSLKGSFIYLKNVLPLCHFSYFWYWFSNFFIFNKFQPF